MLYAATIFVSAFLLFLIQPLIAKQILPWFGGTAAVWTVCLVFFQFVLLAGYIYADRLSRLAPRRQAIVHTVLVLAACAMLPIIPDAAWKPSGEEEPALRILALLAITIGLPYLSVSTTGPLVQSWFAAAHAGDARQSRVWRLFALSNLASLAALVAYPFVLEPYVSLRTQGWAWSGGFLVFAALVITAAWRTERRLRERAVAAPAPAATDATPDTGLAAISTPSLGGYLTWLALAALGTVTLLTVTAHITQDVASVPFLWIVPLALYLLTFILCFDSDRWYRRWLFWPAVIVLAPVMAWLLRSGDRVMSIEYLVVVYAAGLFAVCMFCHGELVRARPAPAWLTRFYLMISLGGALGGLFVGLVAPRIFDAMWELPLALVAVCLMLWWVARRLLDWRLVLVAAGLVLAFAWYFQRNLELAVTDVLPSIAILAAFLALAIGWLRRSAPAAGALGAGMAAACCIWLGQYYVDYIKSGALLVQRDFYGVLRIVEYGEPQDDWHRWALLHGVIAHGEQYSGEALRRRATSYYSDTSGVGVAVSALRGQDRPLRIGVIGLGVGTMAAWGRPGDTVRFYEINPSVIALANTAFSYLRESDAKIETVLGDARLSLEQEADDGQLQQFDLLVVDAFSSDSIPVHLMTREALALYLRHLSPGGVVAFHVSNRHLALGPIAGQLAADAGVLAAQVDDDPDTANHWQSSTDYILVTRSQAFLDDPAVSERANTIEARDGQAVWTDDYNNLLGALKRR